MEHKNTGTCWCFLQEQQQVVLYKARKKLRTDGGYSFCLLTSIWFVHVDGSYKKLYSSTKKGTLKTRKSLVFLLALARSFVRAVGIGAVNKFTGALNWLCVSVIYTCTYVEYPPLSSGESSPTRGTNPNLHTMH